MSPDPQQWKENSILYQPLEKRNSKVVSILLYYLLNSILWRNFIQGKLRDYGEEGMSQGHNETVHMHNGICNFLSHYPYNSPHRKNRLTITLCLHLPHQIMNKSYVTNRSLCHHN